MYGIDTDIKLKDLQSEDTENSHLGPIDYLRWTGISEQFVTCTCDNTDDLRVWNTMGQTPTLSQISRIGQLGNYGLCSAKFAKYIVVPGISTELRVFKAKDVPNKKGEYLEKLFIATISGLQSKFASISDDGMLLCASDGKTIECWRLDTEKEKPELVYKLKTQEEINSLQILRPVNEDNYHEGYGILCYGIGSDIHIDILKEEEKVGYVKIDEDTIWDAHTGKVRIMRLAVSQGKIILLSIGGDKSVKLWEIVSEKLPKCSLLWNIK